MKGEEGPGVRGRGPGIGDRLLAWYRQGHRDLPWRRTADPYRIWVSEIMLQQTRAQAVIPYYQRFLARFPTLESLAAAAEEEVLALWSGLGYYSRARNLRRAAQQLAAASVFPQDYGAIRALPGIGDYTAAAIASIAFHRPHAVLDGNVLRVIARVENDPSDVAASSTRERFRAVAQQWLDPENPGLFNQALMELGATVCLPRNPLCLVCPLAEGCRARQEGVASQLPVKLRKAVPVKLDGTLLIVRRGRSVLLRQREATARRMAGFWDLPSPQDLPAARTGEHFGEIRHSITHHHYTLTVMAACVAARSVPGPEFRWCRKEDFAKVPLSTTARKALKLAGIL
ncbi:MAG: A/G-specific adenine glycosylase [Acidobacteriia bacterium]|nr:A/G-specific adenine glycosylase [Terriglobia bacterium]